MQGAIIDVVTDDKIPFQYFPPEITRQDSVEYASHRVVGKSSPVYKYISGGDRVVRFALSFSNENTVHDVEKQVSRLRALTYPETDGERVKSPPHPVILSCGDLFRDTAFLLLRINTRYHGLFDVDTNLPFAATVELTLVVHKKVNVDYKQVRRFAE